MAYYVQVGSVKLSVDVLKEVNVHLAHAMVGESLESDTITLTYSEKDNDPPQGFVTADTDDVMLDASGDEFWVQDIPVSTGLVPGKLTHGTIIDCYSNDSLVGRYYFDSYKQTGKNKYTLYGVSVIGLLANQKHYGGMYLEASLSTVIEDILSGYSYTIDASIANNTITGYLPIASKRDNLQQVLFAVGATISNNAQGVLQIQPMSSTVVSTLNKSRCFFDGNVNLNDPVTGLHLTEHNYFKSQEVDTLYDDGIYGTETIEFSEPYHSLSISGATIVSSGVNFAVISGQGSVVLTGKKYTHVTRMVEASGSVSGNIKNVENAYLANPSVAQSLADRVFAYLKNNITIKQDIIFEQERAGDVVKVINPYTQQLDNACVKDLDITLSSLQKASGSFVVGYIPQGAISGYQNYILLTGSGKWTVPSGCTKIRLIIVGAGSGGGGGKRGTAGTDSEEDKPGDGGAGGEAGTAGSGGKIFELTVDVVAGKVFAYSCGTRGVGGKGETTSQSQSNGTSGSATKFGDYSSDSGRKYPYGYYEPKTNLTLAADGAIGYNGGAGGKGSDNYDVYADPKVYGEDGKSVESFSGGRGGPPRVDSISERNERNYAGGGGGGAAYGTPGGDAASLESKSSDGGSGATGSAGASGATYGQGGGAGNGGGGGGGGGIAYHWNPTFTSSWMTGKGGDPGDGTDGGDGVNGCIIIYY